MRARPSDPWTSRHLISLIASRRVSAAVPAFRARRSFSGHDEKNADRRTHAEETRVVVLDGTARGFRRRDIDQEATQGKHLSRQGRPGRAQPAGRLRRIRRQPPRLPGFRRNPSRLLPDPRRRPAAPARVAGGRRPAPRKRRRTRRGRRAGRRGRAAPQAARPRRGDRAIAPSMSESDPIEPPSSRRSKRTPKTRPPNRRPRRPNAHGASVGRRPRKRAARRPAEGGSLDGDARRTTVTVGRRRSRAGRGRIRRPCRGA